MSINTNTVLKPVGFFRSLTAPVYALGRLFIAAESLANVAGMYTSKLEMETEKELIPTLRALNDERAKLFPEETTK